MSVSTTNSSANSWERFTKYLTDGGIELGAIYGFDGGLWASTPSNSRDARVSSYGNAPHEYFSKDGRREDRKGRFEGGGVRFGDRSYIFVRGDDKMFYAKAGWTGLVAMHGGNCVVVGRHNENLQPGAAVMMVSRLADWLTMVDWKTLHKQIVDICIGLWGSGLPVYCVLFIVDFMPGFDQTIEFKKVKLIEKVFASIRKARRIPDDELI